MDNMYVSRRMIKYLLITFSLIFSTPISARADFGDADFPLELFNNSPKSYHDVWCRKINNKCRIRFQGQAMWVEGQGGIQVSQYLLHRYELDGNEHYNYISYLSKNGKKKEALFLISNNKTQKNFFNAMLR